MRGNTTRTEGEALARVLGAGRAVWWLTPAAMLSAVVQGTLAVRHSVAEWRGGAAEAWGPWVLTASWSDLADAADAVVVIGLAFVWSVWAARLAALARRRGDLDGPSPVSVGLVQFFFPLTLHYPFLQLRRLARALGAADAVRPALLMYAASAVFLLASPLYATDRLVAWLVADGVWIAATLAGNALALVVLARVQRGAREGSVADVFA